MTGRHGPPLFSLNYNVALAAVNLMRRREADPHHVQGRDRSTNRLDRLWHPKLTMRTSHLQREASIDRCRICGKPPTFPARPQARGTNGRSGTRPGGAR